MRAQMKKLKNLKITTDKWFLFQFGFFNRKKESLDVTPEEAAPMNKVWTEAVDEICYRLFLWWIIPAQNISSVD